MSRISSPSYSRTTNRIFRVKATYFVQANAFSEALNKPAIVANNNVCIVAACDRRSH